LASTGEEQQRLIAAVGYVATPIVPAIVLTSDLRKDPGLRRHAIQALIWTLAFVLLLVLIVIASIALLRVSFFAICLLPFLILIPFAPGVLFARNAYNGRAVNIPLVSALADRLMR
jgi:uncharacterized membrane protein